MHLPGLSQLPRGLNRGSAAARLMGLQAEIPPGAWMSVSCECSVLSGRGICIGLFTHPGEALTHWGCCATKKKTCICQTARLNITRDSLLNWAVFIM